MASFLDLPGELRNMIYMHLLAPSEYLIIDPLFGYAKIVLETAILYTNRLIYRESSSLLYSQNCFNFASFDNGLLTRFLDQIGHNAEYIQNIRISFPLVWIRGDTFDDDHARFIDTLESRCINLRTVTMEERADYIELTLGEFDYVRGLSIIKTRLEAFPYLEKVIVEAYECLNYDIGKEMERLGWVVNTAAESEEEEDWKLGGNWQYDEYCSGFHEDYGDDDFSGDDYDYDI